MTLAELEGQINTLRSRPLVLLCRTPTGQVQCMSVQECIETRSTYIHTIWDELDALLAGELERDME